MKSVNEAILVGHVGSDPEIRTSQGGTMIAKVSLATNHTYKSETRTDWHRLTIFGKLAQVVQDHVRKGDRLYVRGRIEYSTSETPGQGTKYWTDIVVNDLVMLGSGLKVDAPEDMAVTRARLGGPQPDEDLPF